MKSLTNEDEINLVRQLQKGNVSAFNTIYWQYHEPIYRNILKFTKDEEAAADLLQDVFVKFWEKHLAAQLHQRKAQDHQMDSH